MKKVSVLLACLCAVLYTSAQYNTNRNKQWAFGDGAGVDFTSGSPVPFTTPMHALEGSASVSNSAGQLLFYTEGHTVYNRLGAVMPNGSAIVPFLTNSSTQSSVIVPFINDTNKYYLFSVQEFWNPYAPGWLAYSIVDMTLAGGLGDVLPGGGTIIDSGFAEKLISVPGNSCNMWVVAHKKDSTQFCAFNITSAGVNTVPVISNVGAFTGVLGSSLHPGRNNYRCGSMKCSHNRLKIATASQKAASSTVWGIELYDFNPATGIVSNCRVLDSNFAYSSAAIAPYGVEFSPDNTKLYTVNYGLYQWDITLPTTAAIIASKYEVPGAILTGSGKLTDLRLGPDGKIYFNQGAGYLGCISFPNLPGASCGHVLNAVNLAPASTNFGVPNLVWEVYMPTIPSSASICTGMTLTLGAAMGGTWTSTNPAVATISTAGIITGVAPGTSMINYTSQSGCLNSITVTVTAGPTITSGSVCVGMTTTLTASSGGGTWSSGSPNATISSGGMVTGVSAGTAIITYASTAGCSPTTVVTVNPLPPPIVGPTTIAFGSSITLTNAASGGTWSSSDTTTVKVNAIGKITAIAMGSATIYYTLPTGCKVSIVINVIQNTAIHTMATPGKPSLFPNPATNVITIKADQTTFTSFSIYNAVGQVITTQEISSSEIKINVKSYPPGEYRVILTGNNVREMVQFIKW